MVVLTGPGGAGKTAAALHAGHALAKRVPRGPAPRRSARLPGDARRPVRHGGPAAARPGRGRPGHPRRPRGADRRAAQPARRAPGAPAPGRRARRGPAAPAAARHRRLRRTGHLPPRRLAALAGARTFTVSTLAPQDAVLLLTRLVGTGRTAAEPAATAEVARLCGHLPLALCIAGARLAARPDWTIGGFRDRLARHRRRLDQLAVGDLDVRA
ncbi:hypothetical protein LUW77_02775 [Streptomyces radiopugnans]|nr:hypothetical protein LUW77_02775 [Streptomyces radiopugnans]